MAKLHHYCEDYIELLEARIAMLRLIHDNICLEDDDAARMFRDIDALNLNQLHHLLESEIEDKMAEDAIPALDHVIELIEHMAKNKDRDRQKAI